MAKRRPSKKKPSQSNSRKPKASKPKSSKPKRSKSSDSSRPSKPKASEDLSNVKVSIQDIAYGGYGLGKNKGRIIFIPYTIPGEVLRAKIRPHRGKTYFGEGIELLNASGDRGFPDCPHFGLNQCWGCQWQHMNYSAQLLLKFDVLADQLSRFSNLPDHILAKTLQRVIPSPEKWGYNHHMTFEQSNGILGLERDRDQNRGIEKIDVCYVLHPDLMSLYDTISLDFTEAKQVKFQRGSSGETMITLYLATEKAPELSADFITSITAVLPDNEPVSLIGDAHVHYEIQGKKFRVTAGAFFRPNIQQVNDHLIPELMRIIDLKGNESVLDLYAGVGLYSAFIAEHTELVTMVESYPPSVTDAEVNLEDYENIDIIEASVEDALEVFLENEESYQVAIIDPPSSGMSKDALKSLIELRPKQIIYMSSEPSTLGRDAKMLLRAGYHIQYLQPFDFAPHTYYVETMAVFVDARS